MRLSVIFFTLAILGYLSVIEAVVIPEAQLESRSELVGRKEGAAEGGTCGKHEDCKKGLECLLKKCVTKLKNPIPPV